VRVDVLSEHAAAITSIATAAVLRLPVMLG
jgi:energy-converting hydrogenase Eha subunit A